MTVEDDILLDRRGGLMVVTLNRPHALNALSVHMCEVLDHGLQEWQRDPGIGAVLIKGAGERAFCAGGDIRRLYDVLTTQGPEEAVTFYALEYPMNARLHHFRKPWVAVLDGITMGGGVGISVHGSHRVLTERTVFAMPETGIGFFPDVGATWVLPRLAGALGRYLGLTGTRLEPADCLYAGLGTHYVPANRLDDLEAALADADLSGDAHAEVDRVLRRFQADPGPPGLPARRPEIDGCFGHEKLQSVFDALVAQPTRWAGEQLDQLESKSPTSLAVTFRQLQEGAKLDFNAAMRLEYRLVHRFMAGHDFREGVRALIIDKDNQPRWHPARLAEVRPADVDAYFEPVPGGDLPLEGIG